MRLTTFQLSLSRAKALSQVIHLEVSLLPKPVAQYRRLIAALEEGLNLLSALRAIREHIPRSMVAELLAERTELVSSLLITMRAISHSLYQHVSTPQFLPDPNAALGHLIAAMKEQMCARHAVSLAIHGSPPAVAAEPIEAGTSPATTLVEALAPRSALNKPSCPMSKRRRSMLSTRSDPGNLDFGFAFALAENEAISEIITALTAALDICKQLYGEASIIDQQDVQHISLHI